MSTSWHIAWLDFSGDLNVINSRKSSNNVQLFDMPHINSSFPPNTTPEYITTLHATILCHSETGITLEFPRHSDRQSFLALVYVSS